MQDFNLSNKQKRWDIYHKFEKEQKAHFLKKLSEKESLGIFRELYRCAYNLSGKSGFNILDKDKIKTLARVHSIFGKIK